VREALFARLGDLSGRAVLDLYAGSGALGIEALSRGADSLVSVDRSAAALRCIRENLASLGASERAAAQRGDVPAVLRRLARGRQRFDLVLIDPPYASQEAGRALTALVAAGVLAPDATVVLERGRRHPSPEIEGVTLLDERRYGDTVIVQYRVSEPIAGDVERGDSNEF
jgi:16S rRNA (guanine966-N2)-methyltransferase